MKLSAFTAAAGANCLLGTCAASPIDVDVAIIGGGASGIHAAIQLKDAGATVVVVEKQSHIGGHAQTYNDTTTGKSVNIGVVIFQNTDVVKDFYARLGVPSVVTNLSSMTAASPQSYDFSLGVAIPSTNATTTAAQQQASVAAMQAYTDNVLSKYTWLDNGFYIPEPVPEELTMPLGEFAQQYNFTALLPTIALLNWYPGNISTIPAIYGIKGLGPAMLKSYTGGFVLAASGDTQSLYRAAATELGDSVLLNSTITSVERSAKSGSGNGCNVTLLVKQPNQKPKTIRARKLLIAAPPTLSNVGSYDLSKTERSLFSKFSALGYFAGVANIPGLTTSLKNVGLNDPYGQPTIPGTSAFSIVIQPSLVKMGVAFDSANYTTADAEAVVRQDLANLAAAGAVPANAAEAVTFPMLANHAPYNLRVSAEDINDGFYSKFIALQGLHNTYWTGASFTGQNSGLVWAWNNETVLPSLIKDLGL